MPDSSREDLTVKIEAAEERNRQRAGSSSNHSMMERAGETAVEAKDGAFRFAHDHPFTVVLGGFAAGVILGGMFPRHPARKAAKAGGAAAGLAATAADTAMEYIRQALEAAEEVAISGKDKLHEGSRTVGSKLHKAGDVVSDTARDLADDAAAAKNDLSSRASRIIN